jgi:hypothetical protein
VIANFNSIDCWAFAQSRWKGGFGSATALLHHLKHDNRERDLSWTGKNQTVKFQGKGKIFVGRKEQRELEPAQAKKQMNRL